MKLFSCAFLIVATACGTHPQQSESQLGEGNETAQADDLFFACKSIDPTFWPQLYVTIDLSEKMTMNVERTVDGFPGPITTFETHKLQGQVSATGGQFTYDGGSLVIETKDNGHIGAVLNQEELSCQKVETVDALMENGAALPAEELKSPDEAGDEEFKSPDGASDEDAEMQYNPDDKDSSNNGPTEEAEILPAVR